MNSISSIFKIGPGPSSSHTFGPMVASQRMLKEFPLADRYEVILYGSLALTGRGHLTDRIIYETLKDKKVDIFFDIDTSFPHPNTMIIKAFDHDRLSGEHLFESIGGGQITIDHKLDEENKDVYPHDLMDDILSYCKEHHLSLADYVDLFEDLDIDLYLRKVLSAMKDSVKRGLNKEGLLPGSLKISRIAKLLYEKAVSSADPFESRSLLLNSFAYAASEENADGGIVVTSPTMGTCGVIAALVYDLSINGAEEKKIIDGLKVAGLIGCLIQKNASISGAKSGCQAEIGAACCMAAALLASVQGLDLDCIEYAAEIALEHHLGLTCDPVGGYVQIPCIERNAVAVNRAVDACRLAKNILSIRKNKVTLDMVIKTMNMTGDQIPFEYKESSLGGLAVVVPKENK